MIDRTAVSERAVIRHDVELRTGDTWYVALGDRPFIALLLVPSPPPGCLRSPPAQPVTVVPDFHKQKRPDLAARRFRR